MTSAMRLAWKKLVLLYVDSLQIAVSKNLPMVLSEDLLRI